jgi:hypothetical protein
MSWWPEFWMVFFGWKILLKWMFFGGKSNL